MPSALFLSNSLLFLILISISGKDFKDGVIPDVLLAILAILGLFRFGNAHLMSVLILGALAYGLYKLYPLLRKQEGLGLGDVKMMAVSGLWVEPFQIPLFLIMGGVGGVGIALLWHILKRSPRFPLGPALALALGICIVGDNGFSKGENKMTTTFSGPSLSAASGGKPDSIVVLLHGYGADGEDLLSLGKTWASLLPNTLFVAPNGPTPSKRNPFGNQWFNLDNWNPDQPMSKSQIDEIMAEIKTITPSFNQYLDHLLKTHDLTPERLALVGFSQGAMLALHIALHRPQCAGVVAYSGAFWVDPNELKIARPPIFLIHGQADSLVPPSFSEMAEERLKALGVPVNLSLLPGLGHGIDGRGLGMGGAFLKEHLYENAPSDLWEQAKEGNN